MIGNRWSSDSHRVKDFLARNQVPYQWQDIEADTEACSLYEGANAPSCLWWCSPTATNLSNPDNSASGGESRTENAGREAVL